MGKMLIVILAGVGVHLVIYTLFKLIGPISVFNEFWFGSVAGILMAAVAKYTMEDGE